MRRRIRKVKVHPIPSEHFKRLIKAQEIDRAAAYWCGLSVELKVNCWMAAINDDELKRTIKSLLRLNKEFDHALRDLFTNPKSANIARKIAFNK